MTDKQNHIYMRYIVRMTLNTLRNIDGSFTANLYCCFQKKVSWHLKREKQINKILQTSVTCTFPMIQPKQKNTKYTTHRLRVMLQSCVMMFYFIIAEFFNNLIELKTFSLCFSVYFRYPPFCILLKKKNLKQDEVTRCTSILSEAQTHMLYSFFFFL